MTKDDLFQLIGEVDEKKAAAAGIAVTSKPNSRLSWHKWGVLAACLCIIIAGLAVLRVFSHTPGNGTPDAGGRQLDGVDSVMQSISVFPATESFENVENATIENISESDAYAIDTLGAYLPTQLPKGYAFEKASLYETTMKNGTKYHMLRVTYATVQTLSVQSDNGGRVPAPEDLGESFVVFVMDYIPDTEKRIYSADEITERILAETDSGVFHISYDDVYVGISNMDLPASEMVMVILSIGPDTAPAD